LLSERMPTQAYSGNKQQFSHCLHHYVKIIES